MVLVQTRICWYQFKEEQEAHPSQDLCAVREAASNFYFRKVDGDLKLSLGAFPAGRLVGTSDWTIGYFEGKWPMQRVLQVEHSLEIAVCQMC